MSIIAGKCASLAETPSIALMLGIIVVGLVVARATVRWYLRYLRES